MTQMWLHCGVCIRNASVTPRNISVFWRNAQKAYCCYRSNRRNQRTFRHMMDVLDQDCNGGHYLCKEHIRLRNRENRVFLSKAALLFILIIN